MPLLLRLLLLLLVLRLLVLLVLLVLLLCMALLLLRLVCLECCGCWCCGGCCCWRWVLQCWLLVVLLRLVRWLRLLLLHCLLRLRRCMAPPPRARCRICRGCVAAFGAGQVKIGGLARVPGAAFGGSVGAQRKS